MEKVYQNTELLMELTEINSKASWKCDFAALLPSSFHTTQSGCCQWGEKLEIIRALVLQDHCP